MDSNRRIEDTLEDIRDQLKQANQIAIDRLLIERQALDQARAQTLIAYANSGSALDAYPDLRSEVRERLDLSH